MKSYKDEKQQHGEFCVCILNQVADNNNFLAYLVLSDEATFHLNVKL